jgi:hypothetical protein
MGIAIDTAKIVVAAVSTLELGGTDLGPTSENGVTLKSDQTYQEFYVDQQALPVINTLTERKYSIDLELAQTNLANIHAALNLASSALVTSSLTLNGSEAALKTLKIVVPTTGAGSRTMIFDSVRVTSNFSLTMKKKDMAVLPITFTALYSTANSRNGIMGDA